MDIIAKQIKVIQIQEHLELLTNTNSKHKQWLMNAINYWRLELLNLELEIVKILEKQ
tara:strand:+ start:12681 stop:12851 length:171 start_codon:yes stop_codon:yes gene_type:complete